MREADIEACRNLKAHLIDVSIAVSDIHITRKLKKDRAWVLQAIRDMVPRALDLGLEVIVGCEDASRADPDFLLRVAEAAQDSRRAAPALRRHAGRDGTVRRARGHRHPAQHGRSRNRDARARRPRPGHRQHAGRLPAGATHVNTTVNGLGERAGNAPLEEVALGLQKLYGIETGVDLSLFPGAVGHGGAAPRAGRCRGRRAWSATACSRTRPASTSMACSRIRTPIRASTRAKSAARIKLVVGKHSGSHGIIAAYARMGLTAESRRGAGPAAATSALFAERAKRSPADHELLFLYSA